MEKKNRYLLFGAIGFSLLVLAGLYVFAKQNAVYYLRTDEIVERVDEKGLDKVSKTMIRLGALVKEDSVVWSPKTQTLRFVATNRAVKEGNEAVGVPIVDIPVFSIGAGPKMFREGVGVVVEGYYAKPDCTEISKNVEDRADCLGDVAPGAFRSAAKRCGMSRNVIRYGEACQHGAFDQGPVFVSDELLVKHSNEYRMPDEDAEDPMSVYKTVEGM